MIFRTMMKRFISFLISFLMLFSATAPELLSLPKKPTKNELDMSKFTLTWSDEFDGDRLDTSKWDYEWWVTERKGGYWHEDMVSVRDGNLVIKAEYLEEPKTCRADYDWIKPYKPGYYCGQVVTRDKFEQCYGYFECRCILPAATGLWSAFWMMNEGVFNVNGSGEDGTEVDVFESMYYKDHWWGADAVVTGIHYDGYGEGHSGDSIGKYFIENDPYSEYNTYGVEWTPDEYIFYINGKETGRLSTGGVSDHPEYLLLSVEIAGENGVADADRHGTDKITKTPSQNWPAEFKVDYVRAYQFNDRLPQTAEAE